MELKYNVTGADRKRLVAAISEITEVPSKYLGAPTFAYEVDYFTIDKNGTVSLDDRADSDEVEMLVERLLELGFAPEPRFEDLQMTEEEELGLGRQRRDPWGEDGMQANDFPAPDEQEDVTGLTISIPLDKVNVENLKSLLTAKGALIKKALGTVSTDIEVRQGCVSFPWFEVIPQPEEINAYSRFIGKLCAMTKTQKRVTAREKDVDNEKYAFRCFLLRLGFIGAEYKDERKILLSRLSGSSAFKGGAKREVSE